MGFVVFKRLLAGLGLALLAVPSAQAANHGWYWGIEAGIDRPGSISEHEHGILHAQVYDFDLGPAAVVTLGGYLGPQLRIEAELGYRADLFSGYRDGWSDGSLMANVVYEMPFGENMTASIGGGIGAGVVANSSQSDVGLAYQFLAGLAWAIAPHTDLTLQLRYTTVSGPTFDSGGVGPLDYSDLHHQSAMIGLRFAL